MLNVIKLNVVMLSVVMLNANMLNVNMLNIIMLNVIKMNVIVPNVIMPNVVAPFPPFLTATHQQINGLTKTNITTFSTLDKPVHENWTKFCLSTKRLSLELKYGE